MRGIGRVLAKDGFVCQTGAAQGADQAFAEGALCGGGDVSLFLPWPSYEKQWVDGLVGPFSVTSINEFDRMAFLSVAEHHPNFAALSRSVRQLHARNWLILQGIQFVICWTPKGLEAGGTGQAIRIAEQAGVKIHNLGKPDVLAHFIAKLKELGEL